MFSSLADSSLYIPLCGCPLPSEVTLHVAVNKHSSKEGIALTNLVCTSVPARGPASTHPLYGYFRYNTPPVRFQQTPHRTMPCVTPSHSHDRSASLRCALPPLDCYNAGRQCTGTGTSVVSFPAAPASSLLQSFNLSIPEAALDSPTSYRAASTATASPHAHPRLAGLSIKRARNQVRPQPPASGCSER